MVLLHDRATISGGKARITKEGYLVADALVARADNIQAYSAAELGLTDRAATDMVRVFRPASEVFAVDSLRTASRLPIVLDHPVKDGQAVMVDAANWREFAKGETGEEILRDGEFLRVPIRVTDAGAVASVGSDRQEFSLGYTANLRFEAGTFGDQAYDAVATDLRYNHLAACRTARGGEELRITDERTTPTPQPPGATAVKNILVDGLPVNVADAAAAEATISKLVGDRATAQAEATDAKAATAAANTTIAARDAEIITLKEQVAQATLTPQALRDAAVSYGRTVAIAKALGATVTDAMDEPAVRKAAVAHKMGDKAAAFTDTDNTAAFEALAAGLPANQAAAPVHDALRTVLADGPPATLGDAEKAAATARDARQHRYAHAHEGAAAPKFTNGAAAQ